MIELTSGKAVGDIKGDKVIEQDGKLYLTLWKDKMPPEPILALITIEGR
jgi:hypothetical protein